MKISNLFYKEFNETIIRMLNKLKSRIKKLRENFNRIRIYYKGPIRNKEHNNWNECILEEIHSISVNKIKTDLLICKTE